MLSLTGAACGSGDDGTAVGDDSTTTTTTTTAAGSGLSTDFTPTPGIDVDADAVRDELVVAIDQVVAAPFVSIESVGYTEGRWSHVTASVDVAGRGMSTLEMISDGVEVGAPASDAPLVSEMVLVGDDAWLRVLQPGQGETPFQFIDATGLSEQLLPAAYTQLGRVFDSLSQLSQLVATTPFEAQRLVARTINGVETVGVRATFDVGDVEQFLVDNDYATLQADHDHDHDHGSADGTIFELWFDESGLRELVATGVQFQDGEALDTSARIAYQIGKRRADRDTEQHRPVVNQQRVEF